jgi:hypothetical protein
MTDEIVSRETKISNELRKIRFGERVVCYILSRLNESNLTNSKISIELKIRNINNILTKWYVNCCV